MNIHELLAADQSVETGNALLEWARNLRGRIIRGDMMIGILPVEEVELAPLALRRASECGVKDALLELGNWFAQPAIGEPDLASARTAFEDAMSAGVPNAQLRYVQFLWYRCRETASSEEQRRAYKLAEEMISNDDDEGRASYLLSLLTCQGFGTPPDPIKARNLLGVAAAAGNADALFELYIYYETGVGGPKDSAAAIDCLSRAAEMGQSRAMYNLAACLATGRGVEKDLAAAAKWYFKSSEAGNVRATANLATMYAKGEGVRKDFDQAKLYFDEAEYMGLDVSEMRASVGMRLD